MSFRGIVEYGLGSQVLLVWEIEPRSRSFDFEFPRTIYVVHIYSVYAAFLRVLILVEYKCMCVCVWARILYIYII